MRAKNIVVIGGGTGSFTVLSGLKLLTNLNLTAIVAMSDNGGSTGKLRDELGVLPPGDVRQCLVALAESPEILRNLFGYRFESGDLAGHNFGNLFLSALEKVSGSFEQAVATAGSVLSIRGQVLPVTTHNVNLSLTLSNGTQILGEDQIGRTESLAQYGVKDIRLVPEAKINPKAYQAILEADMVIIGPGNFFCSLIPNMLVSGMKEALQKTKATIVYNVNLMSKYGHCDHWSVEDYLIQLHRFIGVEVVDIALYNTSEPSTELVQRYQEEGLPVRKHSSQSQIGKTTLIGSDLIADTIYTNPNKRDLLRRTLIRHDSLKLAEVLYRIIMS